MTKTHVLSSTMALSRDNVVVTIQTGCWKTHNPVLPSPFDYFNINEKPPEESSIIMLVFCFTMEL